MLSSSAKRHQVAMSQCSARPSQPSSTQTATKIQKNCFANGRYFDERVLALSSQGRKASTMIAENMAMTPPSFDGIERRIA